MRWYRWLKERFSQREEIVTYEGIDDLLQYYWNEIHKDYDLSRLIISGKPTEEFLISLWNKIYDQYISEIGLDEDFLSRMKRKKKIISMRYEYVITKNRVLRTLIKIEEALLKEDEKELDKIEFNYRDSVAYMRLFMKFNIDSRTVTVAQYHENAKLMMKHVRES